MELNFGAVMAAEECQGGPIVDAIFQQPEPEPVVEEQEPIKQEFKLSESAVGATAPVPAPINLSLLVISQFDTLKEQAAKVRELAQAVEITDDATLSQAIGIAGDAKRIIKAVDAKRKDVTADASAFVKRVNAACKLITDPLDAAETEIKGKERTYRARAELERRKKEEKARQEARELQAKIDKEAAEKGVEAPKVPEPVMPKAKAPVRSANGTASYERREWKFEITDVEKVPREYLMVDERKIRDAVKMGTRVIPGVRIFEDVNTVHRT